MEKIEKLVATVPSGPGELLAMPTDVTRPGDIERFVEAAVSRWGRIDAVVSNAGSAATRPFALISDADWDVDLQLKLIATVRLVRLALPHMREHGGTVLSVLNLGAKTPWAESLPTSATRAAGMALMKALSKEGGVDNIRSNAILVGVIESGQWQRKASALGQTEADFYSEMAAQLRIPLGRIGSAEEFADVAAFLVSPRASYLSGVAINLDGGLCAAP
jgi:NAD(P)-dependent dehydrogenase (short-subunit alcohol dehydrogenase family)